MGRDPQTAASIGGSRLCRSINHQFNQLLHNAMSKRTAEVVLGLSARAGCWQRGGGQRGDLLWKDERLQISRGSITLAE
jgi:hypothetical protein